jgi:hypothetical protein
VDVVLGSDLPLVARLQSLYYSLFRALPPPRHVAR